MIGVSALHAGEQGYIELPAEYFFGRWTDGHYGQLDVRYIDTRQPEYHGSYSLTWGSNYFAINNIQKYILVDEREEEWKSAHFTFLKRLLPNWQIGLDDFSFREQDYHLRYYIYFNFVNDDFNSTRILPSFSSHFLSDDTLKISNSNGAYSYFFEPMFRAGTFRIENKASLYYLSRSTYRIVFPDSLVRKQSNIRNSSDYIWNLQNNVTLSITDNFYASGALNVRNGISNNKSYTSSDYPNNTFRHSYQEYRDNRLNAYLILKVTGKYISNIYFEAGYFNNYSFAKRTSSSVQTNSADSTIKQEYSSGRKLQSDNWGFSGKIRFINSGNFDNSIILDDYNDFYKTMLFENQFKAELGYELRHYGHLYREQTNDSRLQLSTGYGVSDHLNLGVNTAYGLQRYGPAKIETFNTSFEIQYRNYKYIKNNSPGWLNDDRYDQVFGPILKLGQWYGSIQYFAPRLASAEPGEYQLLDLTKLIQDSEHTLYLNFEFGVGFNTVLTVEDRESYHKDYTASRRYTFGLLTRALNNISFGVQYNQIYNRSTYFDPTVELTIRTLL